MTSEDCTCSPKPAHKPLVSSLLGVVLDLPRRLHRKSPPRLPGELHGDIVQFYVDSVVKKLDVRRYRLGKFMPDQNKALTDLMAVSTTFRKLVCDAWNAYWPVSQPISHYARPVIVRPIVYFEQTYFEQVTLPVDLSPFKRLRFASLNFDNAFEWRENAWHLLPLVSKLPDSLEEIEFLRTHAPERDIFDLVKRLCPNITTLRLVFCNMFNHPECLWWSVHQQEADHHYFRLHDLPEAEGYAELIALQLQGLTRIEHLHLGVYFTPFEAVTAHRVDHTAHHPIQDSWEHIDHILFRSVAHFNADWSAKYPDIPPPDTNIDRLAPLALWERQCPECIQEWAQHSQQAERRAASILAARVGTLRSVSFASFVGDRRTAPSKWSVSRVVEDPCSGQRVNADQDARRLVEYPADALLYSYTKRPGEPCSSRVPLIFRQSDGGWAIRD
ncbi:hypothetical protein FRC07_014290 [Ceratobasidium sp. 392]|nr:hypothetical protein FRC07_014290 [Ceratobasidium sp. 392]